MFPRLRLYSIPDRPSGMRSWHSWRSFHGSSVQSRLERRRLHTELNATTAALAWRRPYWSNCKVMMWIETWHKHAFVRSINENYHHKNHNQHDLLPQSLIQTKVEVGFLGSGDTTVRPVPMEEASLENRIFLILRNELTQRLAPRV